MKKVQNTNTQAPSVMYRIIIFVVSMSVILCAYFGISKIIQTEKEQEYTVGVYNNLIHYIEKAQVTDKELTISGWCFYAGVDSSRNKIQVFLKNVEDETDIVWLDVESVIRTDVDEYFNCEFDYSKTGFDATIKSKKVLLDEKNYEIFIKLTYFVDKVVQAGESEYIEEKEYIKTVSTGNYLCDGVLSACLPEYNLAETEDDFINELVKKGRLLVYRADADMYVYQYESKMYWIAGENCIFEEDGSTKIQFQLATTRSDLLPAERQENGNTWDNISFNFEKNEIETDGASPYRIAVCEIPTNYPITRFWTGYYKNSTWIWREDRSIDIFVLNEK